MPVANDDSNINNTPGLQWAKMDGWMVEKMKEIKE